MASIPSIFVLIMTLSMLIIIRFQIGQANFCSKPNIRPGSTLSPKSTSFWPSPSKYFRFGFYQEGNGFAIGIWLVGTDQKTVVWTARRDDPPVDSNSTLLFTDRGELVILRSSDHDEKVLIPTARSNPAVSASLLDSGNLVLCSHNSTVLWESFKHPTDTILPGQVLPVGYQLLSSASDNDHSTGRFRLVMQGDGNLVLYPVDSDNGYTDAYWASDTTPGGGPIVFHLSLNASTGVLSIVNTTSSEDYRDLNSKANVNESSSDVIFRATVEYEGNFRVYAHTMPRKVTGSNNTSETVKNETEVSMVWQALNKPCDVRGLCGLNRYCTLYDGKPNCFCVPGTEYSSDDAGKRSVGCVRNYTRMGCQSDGKENATLYEMSKMENTRSDDFPYMIFETSNAEECSESCLEDCNCEAAVFEPDEPYGSNSCKKQKLPLKYIWRDFEERVTLFVKVDKGRIATPVRSGRNLPTSVDPDIRKELERANRKTLTRILALVLGFVLLSCVALVISAVYVIKIRILRYKRLRDDGASGLDSDGHGLILRVFSYNDLKIATKGFKEALGKGSFGAVYKGALNKGRKLVAVKRLEKLVEDGEREFRTEMRAIGRTNHKNLVRLLGYCAEGSKRLLVYEYMSNGSLANILFKQASSIDWDERVRIAADVARGILYLHEGCRVPIIHCDIKPQNILMDEFWTAKIADFGLAKFLMPDQTRTLTGIRGTIGYLAPEWHKNTPISVKTDVYSYGIVLLEILCCRRNLEVSASNPEEIVLANWAYKCFVARELNKLVDDEEVDERTLENMVKVALWCIQDQPALRPSMKSVVLMLEGITEVAVPPCPTSP